MVEVIGLTKLYGENRAIHDVSFKVNRGEVVGFLGPNGAGKSTTMRIITGAMAPTEGIARVDGIDVFENPVAVKRKIGYLPETPPVYMDMRVRDYLLYVAELKGVPKADLKKNVSYALERTQLTQVEKRLIGNLSKGFRQRVGIAQALVSNPEVLILDEPTVGLDPRQVAEIRSLIQELRGQHTIILSTHILSEVEATCQRVIIIHKGKIVAEDSLENLTKLKSGTNKAIVRVREVERAQKVLEEFAPGVKVRKGRLSDEFEISFAGQTSGHVMDDLAQFIIKNNLGIVELRLAHANLEEVFLSLTYGSKSSDQLSNSVNHVEEVTL
ncbi:MAG: ABC transporter ATP-binding protein [Bdellovibrionaceae bacterium]|nr:ABC transporter ATP-binding protein [Pseudobdellovibrionaceae bacterium]MDW8190211.1 ABC transporter ATP-binding protein [Pseudobdellovibrionaceae bacterium]